MLASEWREILVEQAVIASHHRNDEETAATAASKWSCGYRHNLILLSMYCSCAKFMVSNHLGMWFLDSTKTKIRI